MDTRRNRRLARQNASSYIPQPRQNIVARPSTNTYDSYGRSARIIENNTSLIEEVDAWILEHQENLQSYSGLLVNYTPTTIFGIAPSELSTILSGTSGEMPQIEESEEIGFREDNVIYLDMNISRRRIHIIVPRDNYLFECYPDKDRVLETLKLNEKFYGHINELNSTFTRVTSFMRFVNPEEIGNNYILFLNPISEMSEEELYFESIKINLKILSYNNYENS